MKFSYNWIAELVDGLSTEAHELERLITLRTAECEGIEPFGVHLAHTRLVRVLETSPFGKGKNQRVRIDVGGGETREVVCGAGNVRPGMLAVWVPPGTRLGEKEIGVATIDGIESHGMLASAAELELSRDHSGLLELTEGEPGSPLPSLRPDWIIDIDNKSLTHRPDLWGHYGMAREIAAITHRPLRNPVPSDLVFTGESPLSVQIENLSQCPRYSALLVENVFVATAPLSWAARLEAIGLHTINNLVDVTNLVLAELPQPMHAFDADKLSGNTIYVRQAHSGEQLHALNGETYHLHPEDLVIADASGPIALAGVIGGADSAISASTKRVVLESANFHPTSVRLTSARYKLRTDASMRFEKSLDPENTTPGLRRAFQLIRQSCPGAHAVGSVAERRAALPEPVVISVPPGYIDRKLGTTVPAPQVQNILNCLGFKTEVASEGYLRATVPSWRATKDVGEKADLVEEVGRMIGYDNIPPQPPLIASVVPPENPMRPYLRKLRQQLASQGFTEIYCYSFISASEASQFGWIPDHLVAIANPIAADLSHLRPSLLPGIWRSIRDNVRHFREFRLFEIGQAIHPASPVPDEIPRAAAAIYSAQADEQEFFEMKRVLEALLPGVRVASTQARPYEHPARTAAVKWHGLDVGRLFEVHPGLLEREGIEGRAVIFDLDLSRTQHVESERPWVYTPPRRYPTSGFDLSVVTDLMTPVAEIYDGLVKFAGPELALVEFVRQYDGPPLPQGQKSVTYHLEIGSLDHTVTADEVTAIRNRIVEGLLSQGFDFRT